MTARGPAGVPEMETPTAVQVVAWIRCLDHYDTPLAIEYVERLLEDSAAIETLRAQLGVPV